MVMIKSYAKQIQSARIRELALELVAQYGTPGEALKVLKRQLELTKTDKKTSRDSWKVMDELDYWNGLGIIPEPETRPSAF
jgi:hypothetical protein